MSKAKAIGSIKLICETCAKEHLLKGDQFNFKYDHSVVKGTDAENIYVADHAFNCDCNAIIQIYININEYPAKTLSCDPHYYTPGSKRQGEFEINIY